jgi:hypothetical protein
MKNAFRNGAFGLIAGMAFVAPQPASAFAVDEYGDFGGTWTRIGPSYNPHVRRYYRRHGPDDYAYYGPDYYDYYGPGYFYYGPGVSFGLAF